jgi:hypothetical protein
VTQDQHSASNGHLTRKGSYLQRLLESMGDSGRPVYFFQLEAVARMGDVERARDYT